MDRRNFLSYAGLCALLTVFWIGAATAAELNVNGDAKAKAGKGSGGDDVSLTMGKEGIAVHVGGNLFTEYRFNIRGTPVLYPLNGPNGENITRHFPMKEGVEGEMTDHEHHRSIWFGHRDVNGESFWGSRPEDGVAKHRGVKRMESGDGGKAAIIVVENDMETAEGEAVYSDERELRFYGLGNGEVLMHYIVTIKADKGTSLTFGNQKDGIMGIRVAPWLRFEDRQKKRGTGEILNGEGIAGREAWGKRADWVDYYGVAPDGKVYGVAMFDHPTNLRHPTWWHARTYGLLTANPFGQGDFEKGTAAEDAGDYTVEKGKELKLHYGFYFHRGDPAKAKVAQRYAAFAKEE